MKVITTLLLAFISLVAYSQKQPCEIIKAERGYWGHPQWPQPQGTMQYRRFDSDTARLDRNGGQLIPDGGGTYAPKWDYPSSVIFYDNNKALTGLQVIGYIDSLKTEIKKANTRAESYKYELDVYRQAHKLKNNTYLR